MIKLLLCILLVLLSAAAGRALTRKYKLRKDFFYQFDLFNTRLINEVSYTKMPLAAFAEKYTFAGDFKKLLGSEEEAGYFSAKCDLAYLTEDDKNFIRDYFAMVGRSDAHSQREYLSSIRSEAERLRAESDAEYKRRAGLYTRLGFLFGLIAAIALV